jgi:hypothetical protein
MIMKSVNLWFAIAVIAAASACSDDDSEPLLDAGPDGSARAGNGGSGGADGGRPVAGDGGAGIDAGDPCSAYSKVPMPLWDPAEVAAVFTRRASLAELCPQGCGGSLVEFMATLECRPVSDDDGGVDGFDGGSGGPPDWFRSEGCGSVQFTPPLPAFAPRIYNFDADSGELIGYAQLDDAAESLPGRAAASCSSFAWLAGEVRHRCDGERLSACDIR